MNLLYIEGHKYAIESIQAVAGMPAAMFDERGPLGTVLANLEQTAKGKPKDYAEGIMGVVRVARETTKR